jgi:hypothetical protein
MRFGLVVRCLQYVLVLSLAFASAASSQQSQRVVPEPDLMMGEATLRKAEAEKVLTDDKSDPLKQISALIEIRLRIIRSQSALRNAIDLQRSQATGLQEEKKNLERIVQSPFFGVDFSRLDELKESELDAQITKRRNELEERRKESEKRTNVQQEVPSGDPDRVKTDLPPGLSPENLRPFPSQSFPPVDSQISQLNNEISNLRFIQRNRERLKVVNDILDSGRDKLVAYEREVGNLDELLQRIDNRLRVLFENNQSQRDFTLWSTAIFGLLIGGVIGAFYWIAFRSQTVRDAVFTGDNGIQFITIFSLVIAVILFGVLKILEGKELSALLGGLSGYILGRGGISRGVVPVAPPAAPAAAPPPPAPAAVAAAPAPAGG